MSPFHSDCFLPSTTLTHPLSPEIPSCPLIRTPQTSDRCQCPPPASPGLPRAPHSPPHSRRLTRVPSQGWRPDVHGRMTSKALGTNPLLSSSSHAVISVLTLITSCIQRRPRPEVPSGHDLGGTLVDPRHHPTVTSPSSTSLILKLTSKHPVLRADVLFPRASLLLHLA